MNHPLGKPRTFFQKLIFGGLFLLGIVALVAGPLAIFSSLNPVAIDNKVTGSTLRFNIEVGNFDDTGVTNQYTIYQNDYVTQLQNINDYLYKSLELNQKPQTRNYDRDLYQVIEMNENSDNVWAMSPPNQDNLYQILEDALEDINATNLEINLNVYYMFDRPNPEGSKGEESAIIVNIMDPNIINREEILTNLRDSVNPDISCADSEYSFTVYKYYAPVIRLTSSLKPDYIQIDGLEADVKFAKHCATVDGQRKDYWSISQSRYFIEEFHEKEHTGIVWITISDKINPYLLQYSVLTFYISVVLVIGKIIRSSAFDLGPHKIFIK